MKTPRPSCHRSLTLESLETRAMMAGNVTVSVVQGSLIVDGDDQPNGLVVEQTAPGTFRVRTYSLGGTLTQLNGSTNNVQTFSGVTVDAIFRLHGERDELRIQAPDGAQAQIPRNLRIDMGDEGNDLDPVNLRVRVGQPNVGGFLNVTAGNVNLNNSWIRETARIGRGSAQLSNVLVGDDLFLGGSAGNDRITVDNVRVGGNLSIQSREGDDFIRVAAKSQVTGRVQILSDTELLVAAGNDRVAIGSLTAHSLRVALGAGTNHVAMFGTSNIGDARIFCGGGTDDVTIDGLHADIFIAWFHEGDDRLEIRNSTIRHAGLHGGDGADQLILGTGNTIEDIDQDGFE